MTSTSSRTRPLGELAALCEAELAGDASLAIRGPASLGDAGPDEISFLAHPRYRGLLRETRAGAVVVGPAEELPELDERPPAERPAILRCENPGRAFSRVILEFTPPDPEPSPGVHATAVVDPTAELGAGVSIGPLCSVGAGARLGDGAVLDAGVHVGAEAAVGARTRLHPGVVLYPRVRVGADCCIHAGSVLGADGFGFEPTPEGWEKTPQCGSVLVEDQVEIGANVTIDRARFGATRIGHGVKIDNLVHLAHNVEVEANAMLIAQTGVAGSTRIGGWAILAGQAGVAGHLEIGAGARVGGSSAVFKDVPAGQDVFGVPAGPKQEQLAMLARQRKFGRLQARVRELEARLQRLEQETERG